MANRDDTAPATKTDLTKLRQELLDTRQELLDRIHDEGKETRQHFDLVVENLLRDFKDAFTDRTAQHDDQLHNIEGRLHTVEQKIGLAA